MRCFLCLSVAMSVAADWPRFRGPNGSGVAEAAPVSWTASENRLWTADLPGKGNGSPIVVKGKLFVQCAGADGSNRTLVCLDAAIGKQLWAKSQNGGTARTHKKNSLASSTPACDGERVYACFWDGRSISLVAYSLTGDELWSQLLGRFASQHGAGMSPIVHAGKVFLNFDQDGSAAMLAFDAKTGDKAWSQPRKAFRTSYSTPIVRSLPDGGSEIVALSTAGLTAYDPASGKVNWDHTFDWGRSPLRSVASPVIAGDVIVCLTGDGGGDRFCAGIKPGSKPTVAWETKSTKIAPYVPCPVAHGKHLYWITDQGMLECIDPLTGKSVWRESAFSSSVSASPILLGETLLLIDERGKALACKAQPSGFEKVASSEAGEAVFATPAAADGKLYLRTSSAIICIGKK